MNIPEVYAYLRRARRTLWAVLEGAPDEVLSRPVLPGRRLHSIKDLVLHIPMIEDSWVHEDFLRDQPVWEAFPFIEAAGGDGPFYAQTPLGTLLDYWRAVEESTLAYLPRLTPEELTRQVVLNGPDGSESASLDGLVWHVLVHEMRHSAQISLLLRQGGVEPPVAGVLDFLELQPVPR